MVSEKEILEALKGIIDPDFQKDIVSLNFVKNVRIDNESVSFDIELTTPACPIKEEFRKKAETLVSGLKGVKTVSVNMTSSPQRKTQERQNSFLSKVGSFVAIASCKGGVGKSTVSALIASTLAERGFKVGLLDVDLYGPSLPTLFQLTKPMRTSPDNNVVYPAEAGGLKLMSFGYLIGNEPAVMRGPIVSKYVQMLLHQVDWGELDYLFVDMPPGTGDIQLTITQQTRLDGAVVVTTPQTLSLVDVARGILMFEKVKVPMLGIVANMAYFMCAGCTEKQYIFGHLPIEKLQERFGIPVLSELPVQPHLGMVSFHSKGRTLLNEEINRMVDNVIRAIGSESGREASVPEITFDDANIMLRWPSGETLTVSNKTLRLNSQDAISVDEMTGERILKSSDIRSDIKPDDIIHVGHYAISVKWNDGHTAGIYSYQLIRELASEPCLKKS